MHSCCRDRLGTIGNSVGTVGTNTLELFKLLLDSWSLRSLQYSQWSLHGPYKKPKCFETETSAVNFLSLGVIVLVIGVIRSFVATLLTCAPALAHSHPEVCQNNFTRKELSEKLYSLSDNYL